MHGIWPRAARLPQPPPTDAISYARWHARALFEARMRGFCEVAFRRFAHLPAGHPIISADTASHRLQLAPIPW